MRFLTIYFILATAFLLLCISCNTSANKKVTNKVADSSEKTMASNSLDNDTNKTANSDTNIFDTSTYTENSNPDSMLAQGMSAMFGKGDSGILKKLGGDKNMDSIMQKMQSII